MLDVLRRRLSKSQTPSREETIRAEIPNVEAEFLDADRSFPGRKMFLRDYALYRAVRHIVEHGVSGDYVECGVLHGRGAALIARYDRGDCTRRMWLYDVFESDPRRRPQSWERYLPLDRGAAELWDEHSQRDNATPSLDMTRNNLRLAGWPEGNTVIVKGLIQDTLPGIVPGKVSLLKLHTDYHDSIAHALKHLYPLLSPGGVVIVDAYGRYSGAKKAADDYFSASRPIMLNRVDDCCYCGVKS